jgi:hypothetical protein
MATTVSRQRVMSPEQVERMMERERVVLELRTRGKSFYQIEKETGIKPASEVFSRAIKREQNVVFRRAEALRLEEARLDQLQDGIWDKAVAGDSRAVEVALKVLERRARLLGLDFADLISGKLVEVEQAKLELVAVALGETLRDLGRPLAEQQAAQQLFFAKVRQLGDAKYEGAHPERLLPTTPDGRVVVEGNVVPALSAADRALL